MPKKTATKLSILGVALLLSTAAQAASTQNTTVTVTGTMQQPTQCTVPASLSLNFGTRDNGTYVTAPLIFTVNCTNGRAYSFTALDNNPVTIGPDTNYISVFEQGQENVTTLGLTPIASTGDGQNQNHQLYFRIHGASSDLTSVIPSTSVGAFSTTVQLAVSY